MVRGTSLRSRLQGKTVAAPVVKKLRAPWGLEYDWLNMQKARKDRKSYRLSGGRSWGVSKASGRVHLPSFIHPTRKLVVIEIAAGPLKQPDFIQQCPAQAVDRSRRQKAPCSAKLDSVADLPR